MNAYVPTPFSVVPNQWNEYSLIADTRTQTWKFALNDVIFHRAQPFRFLNAMSFIDRINLQAIETRVTYVDYVTVMEIDPTSGDVNGDGLLDVKDVDELGLYVRARTNDPGYDIDADTTVDDQDLRIWVESKRRTYFGDANLDGVFNGIDIVAVLEAGQYEDSMLGNSTWATGDWNADGDFDRFDLVVALQDGGYDQGPRTALAAVSVPEPSGVVLMVIAVLIVLLRRIVPSLT